MNEPKFWIEVACPHCKGVGSFGPFKIPECQMCKGTGYKLHRYNNQVEMRDRKRLRYIYDQAMAQLVKPLMTFEEYIKSIDEVIDKL